MKLTKKLAVAFSLVLVTAGMAMAAETVKIGVYLPITGGNAIGGQLELDGVKLAHQQYPTVDGKKIELVVVDNKSDKVESANAVKRLIEKDKVRAIIGTYGSSLAMAGGEVAEKAGIPMVGTSCTNPLVTQGKKYVFRVCFIDPFQGAGAADYALKELKAKSAAMLIEVTEDYSVGLGNFFKQNFTKNGGKIVSVMNYQKGDQDFTAQLTEIISKNPDVLYIPANFAEGAIIMRQARELGAKFSILGGDAMDNPEMVKIGGESVEGFSYTSFAYSPNMPEKLMSPIQKQFTAQWRKAFPGKDPAALTGCGYDAYLLIYNAIKNAKSTDPEKITAAIASTKDMPGVTGTTTINKTHDAEKSVGIIKIENGKQVFHAIVNPK
ncbi:MAG: ABC transporter substrate-binding protein [Cloacibacillus porcorum]|uniref:ABC transporter substrate-binding protein n=1 Tax=Cloacibacillus porcorum TaxID=1197717 RepID=UPI002356B3B2|nr:ABC transporter substrate-binding protein [Cloacibacillus porcorum]MCD7877626.1 ABC transporter substrate-binding protein [Cloacibacillus porcorum]MCI5865911.1 ABC transporter substrate-binding protein [Cloacibacillus porcorum]